MATKKVAGVYCITVIPENKVYIGSSKHLYNRLKRHYWAATSNKKYENTKTNIAKAIRRNGWDNIRIDILECGDKFIDDDYRISIEAKYIAEYGACDPKKGYNTRPAKSSFDKGYTPPREQSRLEKIQRAKPVFIYNYKTEQTLYCMGGAKVAGEFFGQTKDIASHTVKRGCITKKEWYIIPATSDELAKAVNRSSKRRPLTHGKYMNAVNNIIDIAKEYYGIELSYK